jgi:hypothetical protein
MNFFMSKKSLMLSVTLAAFIAVLYFQPKMTLLPSPDIHVPSSPWRAAVRRVNKKVRTLIIKKEVVEKLPPADLMTLHLKSNVHDYNYIFSGQTFCGQQPCAAKVEILVDSSRNPNMHRTIQTMNDGSYWLQVPITETTQEQVDWKILAQSIDGEKADMHGRRILMDDNVVSVEANLNLH